MLEPSQHIYVDIDYLKLRRFLGMLLQITGTISIEFKASYDGVF